jgi:hypothetical protein
LVLGTPHRRSRERASQNHRKKEKEKMGNLMITIPSRNKKGNGKMEKYIEKWCDFHKIP